MKATLISQLNKMDDVDFLELRHCLHIAGICRDMKKRYEKDDKTLADMLRVKPLDFAKMLQGSYPFTLRTIAKIDSVRASLEIKLQEGINNKDSIINPAITHPEYKYSKKSQP